MNYERFSPRIGLQAVTDFTAAVYRVNAYNISTGQYTYNSDCGYDKLQSEGERDGLRRCEGGSRLSDWITSSNKPEVLVNGQKVDVSY